MSCLENDDIWDRLYESFLEENEREPTDEEMEKAWDMYCYEIRSGGYDLDYYDEADYA